jgi:ribokinase
MSKEDGLLEVDVLPLTPIDTVGAGDSFAGALAVALGEGQSLVNAIRFANVAGALATQQAGAQAAIPKREQILARLA